ncbi:unnamed protein product [Ectocarpus sp. 8 AP-2014]
MVAAALVAGACVATTLAQATGADDIFGCDGDTIDNVSLRLALLGWRVVKLYTSLRSVRLAAGWSAGTAFSVELRMRASTLFGRAAVGAGGVQVLPGPSGDASRSRNVTAGAADS